MQTNSNVLTSIDDMMDRLYGKIGTPEREQFRKKAYVYCMGKKHVLCSCFTNVSQNKINDLVSC